MKGTKRLKADCVSLQLNVVEPCRTVLVRPWEAAAAGYHLEGASPWPHGRHFAAGSATIPAASWPHPPAIFTPPAARCSERPTAAEARFSRPATLGSFRIEGGGH